MLSFFQDFHSGWRFLVLLAIVINVVYFAFALLTRSDSKRDRPMSLLFSITVDVQVLLGVILLVLFIADDSFDSGRHIGHLLPMTFVLIPAHAFTVYPRIMGAVSPRTQRLIGLLAPIVALVFIIGGLAAIELGLFEMT